MNKGKNEMAHEKLRKQYQGNHPTITICGVELPKPEKEEPARATKYWLFRPNGVERRYWDGCALELRWLKSDRVHLTEERAQAWVDWCDNYVIKHMQKKSSADQQFRGE